MRVHDFQELVAFFASHSSFARLAD